MERESMTGRPKKPRAVTTVPGYWAGKRALAKFGSHVIDGRSRVAHALDQFRDELIADLGGPEAISKQQEVIVSLAVRTHLMVHSIDNYLLSLGSLVNRRKRSVWPVVRERTALADSLARYMAMLGLAKQQKPQEDLRSYLVRREREIAASPESPETQESPIGEVAETSSLAETPEAIPE
jgi:hypothetical protein